MKIDHFSYGSIKIDGELYGNDVLILPPTVSSSWWRRDGHRLCVDDLAEVIAFGADSLVVGSGVSNMLQVPPSTIRDMESTGTRVEILPTPAAVERFNQLMLEGERVAAALHLTC
jgi:hypothetical protein